VAGHAEHGKSIYTRGGLCFRHTLCFRRLLAHFGRRNFLTVCQHSGWLRWRGSSLEIDGVGFRLLARNRVRLSLLSFPLRWNYSRTRKNLGLEVLFLVGRSAPFRRGSEFSRGRLRTASIVLQATRAAPADLAGIRRHATLESAFVFRQAHRVQYPPLFFPYALVLFALFNIMTVAFWLCVVGANIVWPIALYSCLAFRGGRRPSAAVQQLRALS